MPANKGQGKCCVDGFSFARPAGRGDISEYEHVDRQHDAGQQEDQTSPARSHGSGWRCRAAPAGAGGSGMPHGAAGSRGGRRGGRGAVGKRVLRGSCLVFSVSGQTWFAAQEGAALPSSSAATCGPCKAGLCKAVEEGAVQTMADAGTVVWLCGGVIEVLGEACKALQTCQVGAAPSPARGDGGESLLANPLVTTLAPNAAISSGG